MTQANISVLHLLIPTKMGQKRSKHIYKKNSEQSFYYLLIMVYFLRFLLGILYLLFKIIKIH